ncbi:3283_t:CDS:2 [Cetraspora pellucida]|uniref:3283_t:CDS:1 n=1 Tax=Cetraspora pellucida TaxID=1433469 RepID=A0A9N9HIX4_9GLOM|nr:3283_t:CDS:2 [Cetraspora pellucida]
MNISQELYETNDSFPDEIKSKHDLLYQILNEAQCILNESKSVHNCQRFFENMESKLIPLKKFVEDILKHEKRHTLPRTWKDSNKNTQYCG